MDKPEQIYPIAFISKILRQKVFQYSGDFYQFQTSKDNNVYQFKYRVKKINDIKMMIHTGDWKPVIFLEVELFDFDENLDKTFKNLLLALGGSDNVNGLLDIVAKPTLWEMKHNIGSYLGSTIGFDGTVSITNYDIQFKENESINETKAHRLPIQKMVKDVVTILKTNQEGEFYLPEDIDNNQMVYDFTNVKDISVELIIRKDKKINGFAVNGNYVKDQDVIEVLVVVNPKENINKMLYDIIGELNDLFAHELEHYRQYKSGEFELNSPENEEPFEYYTRPEEIKAQIKGFKRLSKIRRIPLEITIKNWFETHKDIHNLNNSEKDKVVKILLQNS